MNIIELAQMNAISSGLGAILYLEQELREMDELADFFTYIVDRCIDDNNSLQMIETLFNDNIPLDESLLDTFIDHIVQNEELFEITKIVPVKKKQSIPKRVKKLVKMGRQKGYGKVLARAAKRVLLKPKRVGHTLYNLHRHNKLQKPTKNPIKKVGRWIGKQLNKVFRTAGKKKYSYGGI